MWTVQLRKSPYPTTCEYDPRLNRLYLDPSKLKKKGIEYLASAILTVRFRHFMTPASSRDAARVIDRAYAKLLSKKRPVPAKR
jgi:hypothetical protein